MKHLVLLALLLSPSLAPAADHPLTVADFVQQRNALLKQGDFDAVAMEEFERSAIADSTKLWSEGKTKESLDRLSELLDRYPTSLAGNRSGAEAMEFWAAHATTDEHKASFAATAKRFRDIYDGLVQSIEASGDGKTEATAYTVLTVREEYEVIHSLHLQPQSQSLLNDTATHRSYDTFSLKDDNGKTSTMYFDITNFFAAEGRMLNGPGKQPASSQKPDPGASATLTSPPAASGSITYSSGVGATCDDPIVIHGAHGEPDGIPAEYAWVNSHFPKYTRGSQALVSGPGGKSYDRIEFTDMMGGKHSACFDITDFFGKF